MRAALLLMLAGCGRISFESATGSSRDAAIDGVRAVDCTVDPNGTPCDDRNICTSESRCSSGQCLPSVFVPSCTVADSDADFDVNQGTGGWYYGFWEAEGDPAYDAATDFQPGVYGTDSWGAVTPGPFLYVARWGAHPQATPLRVPVRRWVSDVHGPAIANIHVAKDDTVCGDGVEARLLVDSAVVWTQAFAFDDNIGVTLPVAVELVIGSRVDLLLLPLSGDECDTTNMSLVIASP